MIVLRKDTETKLCVEIEYRYLVYRSSASPRSVQKCILLFLLLIYCGYGFFLTELSHRPVPDDVYEL